MDSFDNSDVSLLQTGKVQYGKKDFFCTEVIIPNL